MKVKAAAVQISPVLYSRQGTVEKIVKKIRELAQQGVQFATFPETIIPYYPYFSYVLAPFALAKEHLRLLEESVTVPSAETQAIAEAAKEANMVVSIGVNERDGGSIYNTQLLFDADGTLIQRRRKLRRLITSGYSGARVTARVCAPSIVPLGASDNLPAGSITILWHVMP
jgi:aliphatic nitrilase